MKLDDYVKNLGSSKAIFKITKFEDGIQIGINDPIFAYKPPIIEGDKISELVAANYEESFNSTFNSMVVDKERIKTKCLHKMRAALLNLIVKNAGLKNPRQSKLYRWVDYNSNSNKFHDGITMLWSYYENNKDSQKHIDNVMAILNLMEKHGRS